jgi:hypothetical protein
MAGISLVTKYQSRTSDLIKAKRKSKIFTNQDWSWDGAETIKVATLLSPDLVDYQPSGDSRYGEATEVEDTLQTWTLTEDRSWTKSMDKKNTQDDGGIRQAGRYLAQVTREKLIPEIDTYIFQTITTAGEVDNRDDIATDAATTAANAWTNFLLLTADITNNEAPEEGRVAAMTASYYNFLKQSGMVLDSESGQGTRHSGDLGTVDNVRIVIVPSARMPANTDLIISHPSVCVAPEKLEDYTLHKNPKGISGMLLEYRHRYDAFVDTNKTRSIAIHKTA